MALQDDIFDVTDALKRKPVEKKQFERIMEIFNQLEQDNENLNKVFNALGRGIKALKYIEKEYGNDDFNQRT